MAHQASRWTARSRFEPRPISTLAIALLIGVATPAPLRTQVDKNVTVLSRVNPGGGFSDCWGYVDDSGTELALLCSQNGLFVYDCTDPTQPFAVGFFSAALSGWSPSPWYDVKTYRQYAYVSTEGGSGIQIIDLSNPKLPRFVGTKARTEWDNCHNIQIDTQAGTLYACGTNRGTVVLDLKTDPTNPTRIASISPGAYVHDMYVANGRAHLAELRSNIYSIVDVTNLPTVRPIGGVQSQSTVLHNVWVSRDDRFAATTNEVSGIPIGVYDLTIPARPRLVASVKAGPTQSMVHNVVIHDRIIHCAHYAEGYQAWDLTTPTAPTYIASYDTFPGQTGGFNGAWGVYPFQPSGVVYLSDMRSGLVVIKPDASARTYGDDTPGSNASTPRLRAVGAPFLGNANYALEIDGIPANGRFIVAFAANEGSLKLGGLSVHVDLQAAILLPFTADANGEMMLPVPIQTNLSYIGRHVFLQAFAIDSGTPDGISASRGLDITLFQQ